jgi:hypothetical protein
MLGEAFVQTGQTAKHIKLLSSKVATTGAVAEQLDKTGLGIDFVILAFQPQAL